jgi:hypothetical protein
MRYIPSAYLLVRDGIENWRHDAVNTPAKGRAAISNHLLSSSQIHNQPNTLLLGQESDLAEAKLAD